MLIIKNNNIEFKENDTSIKKLCEYNRIKRERFYIPNNTPFSIKWSNEPKSNTDDEKSLYPRLDFLTINLFPFSSMPLFCFEEDKIIQGYLNSVSENFINDLVRLDEISTVFFENGIELTYDLTETLNNEYNKKDLIENYLTSVDRYNEYEFSLRKCYLEMQENIFDELNKKIIESSKSEEIKEIDLFYDILIPILVETENYIFQEYVLGYVLETEFKKAKKELE